MSLLLKEERVPDVLGEIVPDVEAKAMGFVVESFTCLVLAAPLV